MRRQCIGALLLFAVTAGAGERPALPYMFNQRRPLPQTGGALGSGIGTWSRRYHEHAVEVRGNRGDPRVPFEERVHAIVKDFELARHCSHLLPASSCLRQPWFRCLSNGYTAGRATIRVATSP